MSTREEELIDLDEQAEEVDALAVAVVPPPAALASRVTLPAIAQAAAVAVTGFAAGAVTAAVVHRSRARRPAALAPRRNEGENGLIVQSTRSFLVDVHVLAPRD